MTLQRKKLFEQLILKHLDFIYSTAVRRLKSAELGEALVQKTLETAFLQFSRYDVKRNFKQWLIEILDSAQYGLYPEGCF